MMNNKVKSIIAAALMSTLLFGCGAKTEATNDISTEATDSNDGASISGPAAEILGPPVASSNSEKPSEDRIKESLINALEIVYNRDFSDANSVKDVKDYINSFFSHENAQKVIDKISTYTSKSSISDILITNVVETELTGDADSIYTTKYEIRYNATVTFDKASVYTDIIAVILVDNQNNIIIDSLNEDNF